MKIQEAFSKALMPEFLEAPGYMETDQALALEIMSHPLWPSVMSGALKLFLAHQESTICMLVRFGWDLRTIAGPDAKPGDDITWCEALFKKADPRGVRLTKESL